MNLLLAIVVDTSIVIAIGLAAATLLRRRSAALRHWIIASAVILAVAVPALELALPTWDLPLLPAASVVTDGSLALTSETAPLGTSVSSGQSANPAVRRWDLIILSIWLAGVGVALTLFLISFLNLARLVRRAVIVPASPVVGLASRLAQVYRQRRPVAMFFSEHTAPVITWGFLRPKILLPLNARDWSEERMLVVLQHELAHVLRGDWILQMVAAMLCCVYWFNPLMWMAYRRLRQESEHACDDVVLGSGIDGVDYATHLLALTNEARHQARLWSAASAIAHSSTLEERIQAMLNTRLNRTPLSRAARLSTLAAFVAVALITALISVSAAAAQNSPAAAVTASPPAPLANGLALSKVEGAQAANVIGVLYDQHSGVLPDVEVTLTHGQSGGTHVIRSDASGSFTFDHLPAGDYSLVARLPGFAPVTTSIKLDAGASARRHIMLPIGTVRETISIIGGTEETQTRVTTRPARDLPEPRVPSPCVGRIGGCIKPPLKVVDVKPIYPAALAGAGVQGQVVLLGRIGIDGFMTDLKVVETSGSAGSREADPVLVAAAMEAVGQWEFNPTLLNGTPVEATIMITLNFGLR